MPPALSAAVCKQTTGSRWPTNSASLDNALKLLYFMRLVKLPRPVPFTPEALAGMNKWIPPRKAFYEFHAFLWAMGWPRASISSHWLGATGQPSAPFLRYTGSHRWPGKSETGVLPIDPKLIKEKAEAARENKSLILKRETIISDEEIKNKWRNPKKIHIMNVLKIRLRNCLSRRVMFTYLEHEVFVNIRKHLAIPRKICWYHLWSKSSVYGKGLVVLRMVSQQSQLFQTTILAQVTNPTVVDVACGQQRQLRLRSLYRHCV